ncbi:capsule biosynthesis GfcC D2 domain-containing protein [Erwinia amylovora]|uniref:capsule biosynthesis GfcC D2 domain-containing protein n=1 Tax=Erwinia amylovora TaxID=552 RepID=UPI001443B595|nr:capsule biosynthesis GfcC D2 domain-containing protein [Erwinia amylovora]
MKKTIILLAGILAVLSLQARADGKVNIFYPGQNQPLVVNHMADLEQLVTNPALAQKTWWPGTAIGEKRATAGVIQQQQQLLARLQTWRDQLRNDDDGALAAAVENVRQQIAALKVTGRQFVNLDPDWVRLRPEANRRLEGEYSVYTLKKPTSITLAGVIENSGRTPWVAGRSASGYLSEHPRMSGAERSIALLISPGGEVSEVPVAYWNQRHTEPQAGSTLFVGFSAWTLPRAYADLNIQIVSVLTHRIPD